MTTTPEAVEPIMAITPVPVEPMDTLDYLRMHPATLQLERLGDRLGVIEPLAETRLGQYVIGLGERTHNVVREMNADIADTDHWVIDGAWRQAMYGSQLADRARLVMIFASNAAISAAEHSTMRAGLAAGAVFAAWSGGLGEILVQNAKRLPRAVDAAQEEFPVAVNLMADALPGSYEGETEVEVHEEVVATRGIGKIAAMAKTFARGVTYPLRKGMSSVNFGSTPYVATTKIRGGSDWEARKQYGKVMAFGGAFVTGLAWGVTEQINNFVEDGRYDLAEDLYNFVDSNLTWYALAAVSIGIELGMSIGRKRKLQREGKINEIGEAVEQPALAE